ncbi:hypothetical protein ABZ403_23830 [Micromonospora zamorensis]|uniref:hypothetical protein n=1 Tax=Micromonospora zamorensis TaxID=709883 RepID=UPI0033E233EB
MERSASRRTAFTIALGVGLAATLIAIIWMVVDRATTNSISAHVTSLYSPYGDVPDPIVPWIFLYFTFGLGAICWAVTLLGSVRNAGWVRWFSTGCFLAGTVLLVFGFLVSEHNTAILSTGWRVVCLCMAIYGTVVMLIAWLPTTDRIRA